MKKEYRIAISKALSEAASASSNPTNTFPIGAAISFNGRVVASGHNNMHKTHPEGSGHSSTVHAETAAILQFKTWLFESGITKSNFPSNVTCYIARILKDGSTAPARPCNDCVKMLKRYGITKIIFTNYTETLQHEFI